MYFDVRNFCRCVLKLDEHLIVDENGSILPPMLLFYNICFLIEEGSVIWGPYLSFVVTVWQNDPCEVIKLVGRTRIVNNYYEFALILMPINWAVSNGSILTSNTLDQIKSVVVTV